MRDKVRVEQGDITRFDVDAIVNAAKESLLGGGGVDGAIHRAAGPQLVGACKRIPEVRAGVRCPTGDCRATFAFELPCKFVIHTVGPVWHGGERGEDALLEACYRNSLLLATWLGCRTIAFPAISCGVYRFPTERAARISIRAIEDVLKCGAPLEQIILVAFDSTIHDQWQSAIESLAAH